MKPSLAPRGDARVADVVGKIAEPFSVTGFPAPPRTPLKQKGEA